MLTMNEQLPAIEVEDLITYYGDRQILKRVNLTINQGEISVIMGGSGSGKTTLLRHLLGLKKPDAGRIRLFGKDLAHMPKKDLFELRKNMGVAFQGGALFGSMTLRENVELPLREHTQLDDNTIRIVSRMKLELVNLAGFDDLMPSELSGGMSKRAALARAVVMDPKMLFFDEPSAGLDPVVSAEIDDLILQLRNAMKMTIVVVTHELESAFKIADRITVLDQGEILITDTVENVKNSPNERIQNFLNRKPRKDPVDADTYLNRLTRHG